MNGYGRLSVMKSDLSISGTTLDDALLRARDAASRDFDRRTGRHFYSEVGTYYFTPNRSGLCTLRLRNPSDVISITTLKVDEDGDGTYEKTLTANSDYWLLPNNPNQYEPYRAIELNPQGTNLSAWPRGPRRVQLVGKVGFSDETELTTVTAAEAIDASETAIDLSASGDIEVGETIVIDSEQMYVTAVSTSGAFPMTVVRGINGTTAATHLTAAPIYRRRYPRVIEQVITERVVGMRWDAQTGYQGNGDLAATGGGDNKSYARWMDAIRQFKLPAVA